MMDLDLMALLMPVVLLGGFVRGLTGFGGPLLLVPVFVLFIEPAAAAAMIIVIDLCSNFGLLRQALRGASWRTVGFTVVSSCAAMPLGNAVMLGADPDLVRSLIYVAVGCAALVLLTGLRFPRPMKSYELAGGGAVAGGVMGATALGILIVPVLMSSPDDARTMRANLIVWVFLVSWILLALILRSGHAAVGEIIQGLIFAPLYLMGAVLGQRFFGRLDENLFRKAVLGFLLVFAIAGLFFG